VVVGVTSGAGATACSLLVLPALTLGGVASVLALGDAVSALTLGGAAWELTLGAAVSALTPGSTDSGAEFEVSALLDSVDAVVTGLLFAAVFEAFVLFGAFFGALSGSVVAAVEEEVAAGVPGATSGREPVSAAAAGGV
jgi:hypothetical protein